jgi:mono/diheme cytochrome c family protein
MVLLPPTANGVSLLQDAAKVATPSANPLQDNQDAQAAGQKLFSRECAGCHGENGNGSGRRRTPPLSTYLVKQANPGTLFWILKNGSASHRMPSFSHLPEQQRWQIITFLRRTGT